MTARRVFITGANGFVGRHLIGHMLERFGDDIQVFAAIRPEDVRAAGDWPAMAGWSGRPERHVEVVPFELQEPVQVAGAIRAARPDWIVHLAARSSGAGADRDAIIAVNVEGTRSVLEAASTISPYPRVLVASTGYVYGNTDSDRPAREEDPVGPLWRFGPYTDSKIEMESVAHCYRGFAIVARPFAHTGPGQSPDFALPAFAKQLARIELDLAEPVIHVGNLDAERDILDVRDVVRAYVLLLLEAEAGSTYNVALGRPITIGHALNRLREHCRVPTTVKVDPGRLRRADIACSSGDPLKLRTLTNWSARIGLDNTLRDMLTYWCAIESRTECPGLNSQQIR